MPNVVGERFQITIDKKVRERLGIKPGDRAFESVEGDKLVVTFLPSAHDESMLGILKRYTDRPIEPINDWEAVKERAWAARSAEIREALAAADLVDSGTNLVLSTGVILETIHVLRTDYGFDNPILGDLLIRFLSRKNVELIDADKAGVLDALSWTKNSSARRIADALLSTAAELAEVDFIATFDEKLKSPFIPVRML